MCWTKENGQSLCLFRSGRPEQGDAMKKQYNWLFLVSVALAFYAGCDGSASPSGQVDDHDDADCGSSADGTDPSDPCDGKEDNPACPTEGEGEGEGSPAEGEGEGEGSEGEGEGSDLPACWTLPVMDQRPDANCQPTPPPNGCPPATDDDGDGNPDVFAGQTFYCTDAEIPCIVGRDPVYCSWFCGAPPDGLYDQLVSEAPQGFLFGTCSPTSSRFNT